MTTTSYQEFWNQLQERIAREDFPGASQTMLALKSASKETADTAEDWANLNQRLQSALVLARVKRAHLEAQFNELSEKRSKRASGNTVCAAYERNR